jgi:hypothetical protein
LDEPGRSTWPESFSIFYSLVSRVASSARAYLLAMANIASDVLGFFHGELTDQGRVRESFLEEHDNGHVIDLRDDISLVADMLDELPKGHFLLLDDVG